MNLDRGLLIAESSGVTLPKLIWTESFSVPYQGYAGQCLATPGAVWLVGPGVLTGFTLDGADTVHVTAADSQGHPMVAAGNRLVNFSSGQLFETDGLACKLVTGDLLGLGRGLALDGHSIVTRVDEALHVHAVGQDGATTRTGTLALGAEAQAAAVSGDLLAVYTGELRVFRRSRGGGTWDEMAVAPLPKPCGTPWRPPLSLHGNILFLGAGEDASGGKGIDPEPVGGEATGAVLMFHLQGDTWQLAHRIKCGSPKPNMRYGAFFDTCEDVLAVYRDKRADLYQFSQAGEIQLDKSLSHKSIHSWQKSALTRAGMFARSSSRTAHFFARTVKQAKRPGAKKQAKQAPKIVRKQPKTGTLDGQDVPLLALASGSPSQRAFEQIIDGLQRAWAIDAACVESQYVPALARALEAWPSELRWTGKISKFSYPDAPGWVVLARVAYMGDGGDRETMDAAQVGQMGACPLPPHLEALYLDGSKVRGKQVKELFGGEYLSALRCLDLSDNNLGDAGSKVLGKARLPKLEMLRLHHNTNVGAAGVKAIATNGSFASLRGLNLKHTASKPGGDLRDGVREITEHLSLETLDLTGARLGEEGLRALVAGARATGLRQLRLASNGLGDAAIETLAALVKLEVLDLRSNKILPAGAFSLLPALTELRLSGEQFDGDYLRQLAEAAPRLQTLELSGLVDDIAPLLEHPLAQRLETLVVGGLSDPALQALLDGGRLPRLTTLVVSDNDNTESLRGASGLEGVFCVEAPDPFAAVGWLGARTRGTWDRRG